LNQSQFDATDVRYPNTKGLYIIHQFGSTDPRNHLRQLPADGRWTWAADEVQYPSYYPNGLPVYEKSGINRVDGYDDSRLVPFTWIGPPPPPIPVVPGWIHFYRDRITNQLTEWTVFRGDGKDAWGLASNNVFTPWSNPNSQNQAKQKTWVGIQIANEISKFGTIVLNICFDSTACVALPPSKPQDPQLSLYQGQWGYRYPRLKWAPMQEPDVINSGNMLIHRRVKQQSPNWSAWALLATIAGTDTQYTDMTISTAGSGTDSVQYRLQARDNTAQLSVFSDIVSTNMSSDMWKIGTLDETLPQISDLSQNYPNPFNPTTLVKYQLAEDGFVTLKVFDVLGREIAVLVDGNLTAGYYTVRFDASNLSSGVYFTQMTVSNALAKQVFTKTGKLLLVR
jgi:hypothetical protein